MRKNREYEEQIARYEAEISANRAKFQEYESRIAEYQSKEQALAHALMEAQNLATRLVHDARVQVKEIYDQADSTLENAKRDAQHIRENAAEDAAKLVNDAQVEAQRRKDDMMSELLSYRQNAEQFKKDLDDLAGSAREQANMFAAYIEGLSSRAQFKLFGSDSMKLPDEYDTPAELMRNIYKIQGRDLPENVDAAEGSPSGSSAQAPEERVWTVDEIISSEMDHLEDNVTAELDSIIDDVLKGD